jgi:hypothetical protein
LNDESPFSVTLLVLFGLAFNTGLEAEAINVRIDGNEGLEVE